MRTKKKRFSKGVCIVFAFLIALCVSLIAVRVHNENNELSAQQDNLTPETDYENTPLPRENEDSVIASNPEVVSDEEVGTLIESGSEVNENFFAKGEYYGIASDLTETAFYMGKAGMAFDAQTHPLMSPISINFSENVEVRKAVLYYNDDRYEIYASNISEFEAKMNERDFIDSVLVSLADTNDGELYADVVTFYSFADLG